jgi:hypothetical protein
VQHLDSHFRLKLVVLGSLAIAALVPGGAHAAGSAYVSSADGGGTVKQFDIAADGTLTPKAQPSVGAATANAYAVGITPDGVGVYVTSGANVNPPTELLNQYAALGGGALAAFSPPTLADGGNALAVAVAPDGRHAYVGSNYGAEGPKIFMYDVGPDGSLAAKTPPYISVGYANGLIISPDGKSIYSTGPGSVEQFDIAADGSITPKTPQTVMAGSIPVQGSITPDGKSLYVPDLNNANVLQFDVGADGKITPKNPPTVAAGGTPIRSALSPNGRSLYVMTIGGTLFQYDVGAGGNLVPKTPPAVVVGTSDGEWVTVSPDSRSVYVTADNYVAQFDAGADGALTPKTPPTVPIGSQPAGVALTPDQPPRAKLAATPAAAGVSVKLDGSGSSDPDGAIARYDWSFGDGASAPNGGPKQTHAFAKPGKYTVTLTATDNIGCSLQPMFTGQMAGCIGNPGAQAAVSLDVPGASVSSFALGARTFRAAKKGASVARRARVRVGTRVSYSLNGPAVVKFVVQRAAKGRRVGRACKKPTSRNRKRASCVRWVKQRGSFSVTSAQPGAVSFKFTGRLNRKALKPGRYRLVATPVSGGVPGVAHRLKFRIVR